MTKLVMYGIIELSTEERNLKERGDTLEEVDISVISSGLARWVSRHD